MNIEELTSTVRTMQGDKDRAVRRTNERMDKLENRLEPVFDYVELMLKKLLIEAQSRGETKIEEQLKEAIRLIQGE